MVLVSVYFNRQGWRGKAGPIKEILRCHVGNEVGHLAREHKKAGFKMKIKDVSGAYRRNVAANMAQMLMEVGSPDKDSKILLDSSASEHMVGRADCLHGGVSIKLLSISLSIGRTVHETKQGHVVLVSKISTPGNDYFREFILHEVLCVPGMASNLLFMRKVLSGALCMSLWKQEVPRDRSWTYHA